MLPLSVLWTLAWFEAALPCWRLTTLFQLTKAQVRPPHHFIYPRSWRPISSLYRNIKQWYVSHYLLCFTSSGKDCVFLVRFWLVLWVNMFVRSFAADWFWIALFVTEVILRCVLVCFRLASWVVSAKLRCFLVVQSTPHTFAHIKWIKVLSWQITLNSLVNWFCLLRCHFPCFIGCHFPCLLRCHFPCFIGSHFPCVCFDIRWILFDIVDWYDLRFSDMLAALT
jgi:hypothetical protein